VVSICHLCLSSVGNGSVTLGYIVGGQVPLLVLVSAWILTVLS
jgi:hypothetical protein